MTITDYQPLTKADVRGTHLKVPPRTSDETYLHDWPRNGRDMKALHSPYLPTLPAIFSKRCHRMAGVKTLLQCDLEIMHQTDLVFLIFRSGHDFGQNQLPVFVTGSYRDGPAGTENR